MVQVVNVTPIICFIGPSGSGKTTTIELLLHKLYEYKIGTIKFTHHPHLGIDPIGKDTYRHRAAGGLFTISCAPKETALIINREQRDTLDIIPYFLELNNTILPHVDILFCESLNHPPPEVSIILTAEKENDLVTYSKDLLKDKILAITGKIAQSLPTWNNIPVYDIFDNYTLQLLVNKVTALIKTEN